MAIKDKLELILGKKIVLVHPKDLKNGDYTIIADTTTAEEYFKKIEVAKLPEIERVELVGGRFVNIYLSVDFFQKSLEEIIERGETFGRSEHAKGYKVMVEHTDPNPFKIFHIGHLMPNVIGSTLARIFEWNGAEVKQVNYQGDVGLHVAKAVWALKKGVSLEDSYAEGHKSYEDSLEAKQEIESLNKKIYDKSDEEVNGLYQDGKKNSLEKFEEMYKRLGTKFEHYFFESETGEVGKKIVLDNIPSVFQESEGAVIFTGSHTRVFMNSQGLPTYEAKDLGNAKLKYEWWPYDLSVVVTANEIKEYFRVVLEAMGKIFPDLAQKTKHITHGVLRLPTGKMSSRTGTIISAEYLIEQVKEKTQGSEAVAIAAIKYMILRQSLGHDIVFDIEKSVSTEGDSGVYLQYAHARACSVLEKAGAEKAEEVHETHEIEKLLYRFPEVVERAGAEYAPNHITTYLTELASAFNSFYASNPILGNAHRIAITKAFKNVMKNGLTILGISAPERM